ncbi:radical SAM/SPASM domain-containing protein [Flavobacterium sp. LB1P62]|uniref:radical SAM/SPASM domain-containing protein n=1 Tax=unclassified Flavobacterium TaxID=196869 RepID=UPI003AAD012A
MNNDNYISQSVSVSFIKEDTTKVSQTQNRQSLVSGWRKKLTVLSFRLTIIGIAIKSYNNPWNWIYVPLTLIKLRRKNLGQHFLNKLAYVDNRYYWGLYTPGWNGIPFKRFIAAEMNHVIPVKQKTNRFINAYVAITKKCSLQCEHCYEWENLNKKETLSPDQLKSIVAKIQERGVSQIHFSGGEPLLKVDLLVDLLNSSKKETDFWVLTSGYKLTPENAKKLKTAGLNGVIISLDHFDPEKHNHFRGFKEAYYWVEKGVQNAIANRLVVALSLCASKDFTTLDNLMEYASLAKKLGVSFIQILEPKAVGHYHGKEVSLSTEQISLLEDFYLEMNYNPKYNNYPLISYHGYYQRRQGCYAAGNRSFYVDTDGDINACPFCQTKTGNVLDANFDQSIMELQSFGCQQFIRKDNLKN